jgi:hypothetical protein
MSKYHLDLDYQILNLDISVDELNEIIKEADIITEENPGEVIYQFHTCT